VGKRFSRWCRRGLLGFLSLSFHSRIRGDRHQIQGVPTTTPDASQPVWHGGEYAGSGEFLFREM